MCPKLALNLVKTLIFARSISQTPKILWSSISIILWNVTFEVFMAVRIVMLFQVVAPCGLAGRCHHIGKTYCLHLQGWRLKSHASPKCWRLAMSLHGAKTKESRHFMLALFLFPKTASANLCASKQIFYAMLIKKY